MDLLTFTLVIMDSITHIQERTGLTNRDWQWRTWPGPGGGFWVDATPTFPVGGLKYNMDGTRWTW